MSSPPRMMAAERTAITDLMRAAVDEDVTVLLKMLLSGNYQANLFMRDSKGRTALDWARLCRNYHAVTLLLQAMSSGIANARLDAMHSPLELEIYIKETNAAQAAELMTAIKERDTNKTVRILTDNKLYREEVEGLGEVFFTDAVGHSGYTPLLLASGFNMVEVVDSLLQYKVPIDHANKFGHTAFTYACAAGNSDIVRLLLFFGANVHHLTAERRSGLHYACMYAKARTVKVILDFLLERFATFRIEGHSLIDFDSTRWTKYAEILEGLINVRDKNGKLATDLIPHSLQTGLAIESRLKLSGVAMLPALDFRPRDERSTEANHDYADTDRDDMSALSDLHDTEYHFEYDPIDMGEGLENAFPAPHASNAQFIQRLPVGLGIADDSQVLMENSHEDFQRSEIISNLLPAVGLDHEAKNSHDNQNDSTALSTHRSLQDDWESQSRVSDVSASTYVSQAQFTHDTDNMHATGIHNITDAHSIQTALPLQNEVDIIRGLFGHTRERIIAWLDAAAKESELARLVACPLNCGMMCKIETLTFHVRDDCPFRSLQCQLCHKPVRYIDLKQHDLKLCPKRVIACPNAYQGCCEKITPDTQEAHLMLKCKQRKVNCRQFCGAVTTYSKRESHEEHHCKNRTIHCDQCGESMVANTYTAHLHNTCPERLIKCSVSCGLKFKAKEVHQHEQEVCIRPCKWHCGQRIGPPEQLALHETNLCPDKPMQCKYACGTMHLTLKDVHFHEQNMCLLRPVKCTHGCGRTLPVKEIPAHVAIFRGHCAERPVRCPSNLVGWRVMLLPQNKEGIVLQYRRYAEPIQASSSTALVVRDASANDMDAEQDAKGNKSLDVPSSSSAKPVDQLFLRMEDQQMWVDYWTCPFILLRKVQGEHLSKYEHIDLKFPCGWISHADIDHHLCHECTNREIYLAGANDRKVSYVGQKTKFKEAVAVAEKRHKFDHFVEDFVTQPSTEFCGFCSTELECSKMEAHQKNDCVEFLVKCPYICGKELRRKELDAHLRDTCSKRVVLCVECNSKDLWAEEMESHLLHMCDMRIVPCPLHCNDDKVTACGVEQHLRQHCMLRPIQCTCGLTMPFQDLDEHQRLHCNDRYYYCPQGCGVQVKAESEEYHTEYLCSNKNFRYQKDVDCPNACGAIMMIRDVLTHLSYACPRRMVECTLNCGNTVQLDRLAAHMVFCPMRILPCEPGMHACNRPLHAWFHIEERKYDRDILDQMHGEEDDSLYGDSIAADASVLDGTSIVSHDGKTLIQYTDADLVRAGLADREHRVHVKAHGRVAPELDAESLEGDTAPQSAAQIAKRVAATNRVMDGLIPTHIPTFAERNQVTLFESKEVNIQFNKKNGTNLFASMQVKSNSVMRSPRGGGNNAVFMKDRTSLASDSSVYKDGFQMKFHHHLRLHTCHLHGQSMIFSAIRHNDFALMEAICKQIKDSEDIDFENIYGDTVLTLACRQGKLNFIELLVEHMADINKETSNGRTALIEAVKAPVENIPILEYLIANGCLVNYKTAKHQRTALHWAQRMNRTKSIRILELAIIVQIQANKIFFAISTGKYDFVCDMIKEGEFFDPNGESKCYAEMKRYADLEDDTRELLNATRKKLEQRGNAADIALTRYTEAQEELSIAQNELDEAFAVEDQVNQRISKEFAAFEKNSLRLGPVDIQEVSALKKPELLLRLAAFGYGVFFGVLDSDDWSPVTPANLQSSAKWWPLLMKEFAKPNEVVRKIQSFTIARLDGGRNVDIINRAKQLFQDMIDFLAGEKRKLLALTTGSSLESGNSSPLNSFRRSRTNTAGGKESGARALPRGQSMSQLSTNAGSASLIQDVFDGDEKNNNFPGQDGIAGDPSRGPISDLDWDSDAENEESVAGTGVWEKGEWVPTQTKKDKWWEQAPAEKIAERDTSQYLKAKKNNKFVYLSDEVISQTVQRAPVDAGMQLARARTPGAAQTARNNAFDENSLMTGFTNVFGELSVESSLVFSDMDSEGGTSRASSRTSSPTRTLRKQASQSRKLNRAQTFSPETGGKSRKLSRSRSSKERNGSRGGKRARRALEEPPRSVLDIPVEEHLSVLDYDTVECLPFIEAMFFMFKAIARYDEDRKNLQEAKKDSSKKSIAREDISFKVEELKADYEAEFNVRAEAEGQVIDYLKKERFYKARVKGFLEKVRVARLLNDVSMNGHTAISWAAAVGAYEVVEDMLSHGATVGFPIPLLNLTATFLQMSYKIYRMSCKARPAPPSEDDDDLNTAPPPKVDTIGLVRDITAMKELRGKVLSKIVFMRSRTRFPIPEAVYAGKWEIVKRIYQRRLYHAHFSNTWIFPSAPFPYLRKLEKQYERRKLTLREVLAYAMNDNAAGSYVAGIGWVGPNDHREPFGETQHEIAAILLDLHEKNEKFLAGRKRIRLLAMERINQRSGERAMLRAIKAKDFRKCMSLAMDRGITIDLETPEGYTVMLAAAEENIDAANHNLMKNDDGRPCLAVEFLLDRMYYRPSVNLEGTVSGHNALIRATILCRAPVVEALLDRGADINYQNRVGRTALHYAAAAGDAICTRMLVERFADKTLRDHKGQTAYEIADSENFSNIMKLLSQFRGGFLGPVQISRGRVNNVVKCPIGCGMNMFPREQEAHCVVCEWRPAECPNDCGDARLMWKEIPDHLERFCGRRILMCHDCDMDLEARDMDLHRAEHCTGRLVPCPLGCGYDCKFADLDRHKIHCSWRIIPCPLLCSEEMRAKDSSHHVKELCENRRVPCPYKCRGLVVHKLIPIHMETLCLNRPVLCQFCATTVTKQLLDRHEKECDLRLTPCVDKCGDLVPFADMAKHLDNECIHRFVECTQHCGVKIRVKNMEFHTTTQCPERMSPCEFGCVVSEEVPIAERVVCKILSKTMHLHLKYDCPERQNRCSLCLQQVKAKRVAVHDREECARRTVNCRVPGCLKTMPFDELDNHERNTCRFRLVVCKQSCGEKIPFIHSGIHMKKSCKCRYLPCPLQCATQLRFTELEEHLLFECPRRHSLGGLQNLSGEALVTAAMNRAPKSRANSPSADTKSANKNTNKNNTSFVGETLGFEAEEPPEGAASPAKSPGKRNEVYHKVNKMSAEVSESLKMLALGDRAWNSNIGSRSKKVRKNPPVRSRSPAKDKKLESTTATAVVPNSAPGDTISSSET